MKLENQVCSLELAKELKELGVKQESLWDWEYHSQDGKKWFWEIQPLFSGYVKEELRTSAFTVAELGEYLKVISSDELHIFYLEQNDEWVSNFYDYTPDFPQYTSNTEADARAKMLIYLIKNNLIKLGIEKGGE